MKKPEMIFKNWIDISKLNLYFISSNAIDYIIKTNNICWFNMSCNANAIDILKKPR